MKTFGGSGGIAPSFLTSALDGCEWSALRLCQYLREEPPVPFAYETGRATESV
jgi:hypothetical protein